MRTSELVQTRLLKEDKKKLNKLAVSYGMTTYEFVQAFLTMLLRYFDIGSSVSEEYTTLFNALFYENFFCTNSFSPLKIKDNKYLVPLSAILFTDCKVKKEARPQAILFSKEGGKMIESYNYDVMLEMLLSAAAPEVLRTLQETKEKSRNFSLISTLYDLIESKAPFYAVKDEDEEEDSIAAEIRELFSDIRIPSGEKINEDEIAYKRKNNKRQENNYSCVTEEAFRHRFHADI